MGKSGVNITPNAVLRYTSLKVELGNIPRAIILVMVASILFSVVGSPQRSVPLNQASDSSQWKLFANRAGWTIRHPDNWQVGSCHQCSDPTDPNVFVTLYNPLTKDLIMIEHLIDKPADQSIDQWLNHVSAVTDPNPRVSKEWITLDGVRALKVVNHYSDSTEGENIYIVHGSDTFAIGTNRNMQSYRLYQQMLATFRFTGGEGRVKSK